MKTITSARLLALLAPDAISMKQVMDEILQDYPTHQDSSGTQALEQNKIKPTETATLSCCTDTLEDYVPFVTNCEDGVITVTSPVMSLTTYNDLMQGAEQMFASGTVSPLGLLLDENESNQYYVCNAKACNPFKRESRYETENVHNLPFQECMKEFCLQFGALQNCATCKQAQSSICGIYRNGVVCNGCEGVGLSILHEVFLPMLSVGDLDSDQNKCPVLRQLHDYTHALQQQSIQVLRIFCCKYGFAGLCASPGCLNEFPSKNVYTYFTEDGMDLARQHQTLLPETKFFDGMCGFFVQEDREKVLDALLSEEATGSYYIVQYQIPRAIPKISDTLGDFGGWNFIPDTYGSVNFIVVKAIIKVRLLSTTADGDGDVVLDAASVLGEDGDT